MSMPKRMDILYVQTNVHKALALVPDVSHTHLRQIAGTLAGSIWQSANMAPDPCHCLAEVRLSLQRNVQGDVTTLDQLCQDKRAKMTDNIYID